jgi:hypothetical protein
MARYDALAQFLDNQSMPVWQAKFDDIENVLGFPLPASAHRHSAWWANQRGAGHSQVRGWRDVGWRTSEVDLQRKSVKFERELPSAAKPVADIWSMAQASTGISDRETLIVEGLKALIARNAAGKLAALGGMMPDLVVPARERPFS